MYQFITQQKQIQFPDTQHGEKDETQNNGDNKQLVTNKESELVTTQVEIRVEEKEQEHLTIMEHDEATNPETHKNKVQDKEIDKENGKESKKEIEIPETHNDKVQHKEIDEENEKESKKEIKIPEDKENQLDKEEHEKESNKELEIREDEENQLDQEENEIESKKETEILEDEENELDQEENEIESKKEIEIPEDEENQFDQEVDENNAKKSNKEDKILEESDHATQQLTTQNEISNTRPNEPDMGEQLTKETQASCQADQMLEINDENNTPTKEMSVQIQIENEESTEAPEQDILQTAGNNFVSHYNILVALKSYP